MEQQETGGCLCHNIRYSFARTSALSSHHCHCNDCKKCTGSGKATIVLVPESALKIQGIVKYFTVTGSEGSQVTRGFCPQCGSPLVSYVQESADFKFVKAGSLDDSSWLQIDSSYWQKSAVNWAPTDPSIPCFGGNPDSV
ncbi:MAG: GFA family protein [Gammaproteobacteria bacterium]|jgi:hypothetical protein|nr:GFA family protein [Gammaproteobacteria bacterium]MBT5603242.1 GFA family protein [Gammaproteobacteria bacterium]MBT6244772.1 GFA family protein [Gammaproteobacteria bacterium]